MKKAVLDHFKTVDPLLYQAIDEDIRIFALDQSTHPEEDLFVRLTRSIVGQQLSGKAAAAIFNRFQSHFDSGVTAESIVKLSEHDLRGLGMSYAKARALRDYAYKYIEGSVSFRDITKKTDDQIKDMLLTIKGVGPWTADMFLMFSLARPDVFAPKDLGLQKGIQKIYNLQAKPDEKEALEISHKWAPFRTYAAVILWHHLDT